MKLSPKIATVGRECVACGTCLSVCPMKAISIFSGISAQIKASCCVGCGKCEKICPAAVITIIKREDMANEKKLV